MAEQNTPIISRTYRKASDLQAFFVKRVSGDEIAGEMFRFEVWLNNKEQNNKAVASGNKYQIRRAFITSLLDAHEDGWSKSASGNFGNASFFDPAEL